MQRRLSRVPARREPAIACTDSAARIWAPLARFIEAEARIGHWAGRRPATHALYELVRFGIKQGWACLFGALLLYQLVLLPAWSNFRYRVGGLAPRIMLRLNALIWLAIALATVGCVIALLQQTPETQLPLWHWFAAVQVPPFAEGDAQRSSWPAGICWQPRLHA